MVATFVIGLREGLEAALIVGVVATFLHRAGRADLLRQMWLGVGLAIALCLAVAVGLQLASAEMPQAEQEGLETVVGALAVVLVTSMIVWTRTHARRLKGDLEKATAQALAVGSAWALTVMAFLAVLREGFETAVFLLATFQASVTPLAAGVGAVAGIAVAALIGAGIYRGGVRLDLPRFFRVTGVALVVVAAGLVLSALHTAHEAGWLNVGQEPLLDLTWLVQPGSVIAAVLTGVLGLQPHPTRIEVAGWLLYAIPVALYAAWPARRRPSTTRHEAVRASA